MFKLESYLTPILLSYVDKYIKNFRPEDAQVSLWGGDASFHNLDLRLEVLEQELHLPLNFISGHIHDLIIHVPWTKLASEPINITINTIECILKLKDENESSETSSVSSEQKREEKRKKLTKPEVDMSNQPPGYMQNLVTKIVNNICINCNNVILKYVEEDIVVSVNIRMLKLSSANSKWLPAFTEISSGFTFLRKLMSITDLTICLDKRNAAGKIDFYQEPMLYRCSLELRILQSYHPLLTKKCSILRVDLHCKSLEFSMTEQQIPMLIRLVLLSQVLMQRFSKKTDNCDELNQSEENDSESEIINSGESWTGWAWSFIPSIFPATDNDWGNDNIPPLSGHTLHFGVYVDNLSLIFKISECTNEGNFYVAKKIKYWPLIRANITGICLNFIQHSSVWSNIQGGISQITIIPQGNCSCGVPEIVEALEPVQYLHIGTNNNKYIDDSLFDSNSVENNSGRRVYNFNWNQHLQIYSETYLLETTPAFAFDILHQLELDDEMTIEKIAEFKGDFEYSNIKERVIQRVMLGTINFKICSGFIHRINAIYKAAMAYDYSPYNSNVDEIQRIELKPPSTDDFDALNEFIPQMVIQFTAFNIKIELFLIDHGFFEPMKGNLRRKRKGSSSYLMKPNNLDNLPRLLIEMQCIDAKLTQPIYPNRLIHTTCQLPQPPDAMLESCHRYTDVKILGLASNLIVKDRTCILMTPCTLVFSYKNILLPRFWSDHNMPHLEVNFKSEKITFALTKVTLLMSMYILESYKLMDDKLKNDIYNSSLLEDVPQTTAGILEINMEDIKIRFVTTLSTSTCQIIVCSLKAFILEKTIKSTFCTKDQYFQSKLKRSGSRTVKESQLVMVFSGPDLTDTEIDTIYDIPFFSIIAQYSNSNLKQIHPSLMTFHLAEAKINFDPLMLRWLQYEPRIIIKDSCTCLSVNDCIRKGNFSETSTIIDTPRRTVNTHESVHSSDREQLYPTVIPKVSKEIEKDTNQFLDKAVNFYNTWSNIILYGTISSCIIYFPTKTLMASDAVTIQEALDSTYNLNKDLEVFVLKMPTISIQNSSHLQSLHKYTAQFPIQVPENIWLPRKIFFPWTLNIENLSCWTLQNGEVLSLIKSITWNIAVDVSVKYNSINFSKECDTCGFKAEHSVLDVVNAYDIKHSATIQYCSNCSAAINSLSNMDLRVYVDTPPVQINVSDPQVYLLTYLTNNIYQVIMNFIPNNIIKSELTLPKNICIHHTIPVSTPSISLYRESTPRSESLSEPPQPEITIIPVEDDPIKLSALFQWTLSRLRINIFSQDLTQLNDNLNTKSDIKLTINMEDIFTSVNIQKVYMKTEARIATVNIYQYKRVQKLDGSCKWELGPYLGLVMRNQDEDSSVSGTIPDNQGSFLKIILTQVRCDHVHNKWGVSSKIKIEDSKSAPKNIKDETKIRFITEIDINIQPIDILLSIATLKMFMQNFYDSLRGTDSYSGVETNCNILKRTATTSSQNTLDEKLYMFNNHQLPLLHIDCRSIRIIMPANELVKKTNVQDVCIFQISHINLQPNAKNPICRTPLRPDLYQQAARTEMLNIPGADIEDRQYELTITELSVASGNWTQLDPVLNREVTNAVPSLRTMNENPALEWNNLDNKRFNIRPNFNLIHIISSLNSSLIFAPAIVSSKGVLICGHSLEINALSDLDIKICTTQISLALELATECVNIFEPIISHKYARKMKFRSPQHRKNSVIGKIIHTSIDETTESEDNDIKDSGVEVTDDLYQNTFSNQSEHEKCPKDDLLFYNTVENIDSKQILHVPVDILLTGGNMSVIIYQFESSTKTASYFYRIDSLVKNDDQGYEASEESSQEELQIYGKRTQPLIYALIGQPSIYVSRLLFERKVHFSIYDVKVMISTDKNNFVNGTPTKSNFETNLIETKLGQPNSTTGILPAFITFKLSQRISNIIEVSIEISRPTKLHFSLKNWEFLISLMNLIFKVTNTVSRLDKEPVFEDHGKQYTKSNETGCSDFVKYRKYQKQLLNLTSFHFQSSQIVFGLTTKNSMEVLLACENINNHFTIKNRPERMINSLSIECLTLSVINDDYSRLLLNPWSVNSVTNLFWESWQDFDSNPQISITVDTDCLRFDIGSEHLQCLEILAEECQEFLNTFNENITETTTTPTSHKVADVKLISVVNYSAEKDQHYKDDLRAGAFQFIDANVIGGAYDELPLPYQVLFTKHPQMAMSWRYPQPRALTKVRVFPVPFRETKSYNNNSSNNTIDNHQVLCRIEYWSEAQSAYKAFAQFQLSESEMYQLDVERKVPQPAVSCIWRVVLLTSNTTGNSSNSYDDNNVQNLLSPRTLAACIRIDSYFNPLLIPTVQMSINISTLQLHLLNYMDKKINFKMPSSMKEYVPDRTLPENQCFLVFSVEKVHYYAAYWVLNDLYVGFDGIMQCSILDYAFLSRQHFIEQSAMQLSLGLSENIDLNIRTKPIKINFSPSIGHTLATSMELWGQTWTNRNRLDIDNLEIVVLTRYVICNDTNMDLHFGQAATDEDIYLESRHCHLYSWRSQKCKQLLRVALNENNNWIWSVPFIISKDGTSICNIEGKTKMTLFLTVRSLSTTQKQIVFSSDLTIVNNLNEQLEVKLFSISDNKEMAFRTANTHLLSSKSRYSSLQLETDAKNMRLRVRYFGLDSAWSGDIPIIENTSCDQPWLVKVPLHERGHFLSVWCQIIIQEISGNFRYLAVFWPLFMIRSNLPVDAKVNIQTPTLQVSLETTIAGRGKLQQLYCPGTTDHSHQLTFKLECSPPSNPYVPLNYSLVNQKSFFKRPEQCDIEEILKIIQNFDKTDWPFYEKLNYSNWIADDQPLTHVQVRYDKLCQYSSSLLIELLPWCLLLNTCGYTISIILNTQEICRINHYGIATPPRFEESFCFGINFSSTCYISNPIEFSSIPIEGYYSTIVYCDLMISRLLITSYERNEMRIMNINCSHILTNTTDFNLHVCCIAIPESSENKDVPNNLAVNSFCVPANIAKKLNSVPLMKWIQYGICEGLSLNEISFYLFLSIDNKDFSRPIRVDKMSRQTFSILDENISVPFVLTVNEHDGCLNITIHRDLYPQLIIKNNTCYDIAIGEYEKNGGAIELNAFNWRCVVKSEEVRHYTMPSVTNFFPDISRSFTYPKLTLTANIKVDNGNFEWCEGIDISTDNEVYIRTSNVGDIKVSITIKCHTTEAVIDSVSQIEFSAGDVRNRLQMILKEDSSCSSEIFQNQQMLLNDETSTGNSLIENDIFSNSKQKNSPCTPCHRLSTIPENKNDTCTNSEISVLSDMGTKSIIMKLRSIFQMKLNFNMEMQGVILTLSKDLLSDSYKTTEIAAFYIDQLALNLWESEDEKCLTLSISDMQFDNQLYSQGTFDFPVVFQFDSFGDEDLLETQLNDNASSSSLTSNSFSSLKKFVEFKTIIKKWSVHTNEQDKEQFSGIHTIYLRLKPFKAFIESDYMLELVDYIKSMMPINLVILPQTINEERELLQKNYVYITENLLLESEILAKPIKINSLIIEPVIGAITLRSHIKVYVALDDSPVSFPIFQRKNIVTTPYRLGHALTVHFLSGAIVGAGWMVGALEILGNPGGLARSVGVGLKDFISKPYEGIMNGPWGLVVGVSQGSASLVRNITAGTLNSVSKLAGSLARNLDILSLDKDHLQRAEEARRQRPSGMVSQIAHGFTNFGISLLGAVGGLAQQPLQSVVSEGASPIALATGFGKGLMGIITKPLGGAAELLAVTGNAILQETGWKALPNPRCTPIFHHIFNTDNASVKYSWKLLTIDTTNCSINILCDTEATMIGCKGEYHAVALILTLDELILVNTDEDITQQIIPLKELEPVLDNITDPTLLCFNFIMEKPVPTENILEMDPAARARVVDYVRSTVSGLSDISSLSSIDMLSNTVTEINKPPALMFYVNPQWRNYFLNVLLLAKRHSQQQGFTIL